MHISLYNTHIWLLLRFWQKIEELDLFKWFKNKWKDKLYTYFNFYSYIWWIRTNIMIVLKYRLINKLYIYISMYYVFPKLISLKIGAELTLLYQSYFVRFSTHLLLKEALEWCFPSRYPLVTQEMFHVCPFNGR